MLLPAHLRHYIKNISAEEHRILFPEAAHAIGHDTYMDIGSVDHTDKAVQLAGDIVEVQKRAYLEIRGWASNEPSALALVPSKLRLNISSDNLVDIGNHQQSVRTLGLIWYPLTDQLGFNAEALKVVIVLSNKITKRIAISTLMRVFDPLGMLALITIRGRIIFQVLWRRKVEWYEVLPQDLLSQ